eukprot:TRINITY_DN8465_c0_g1_i1.p1 TRINITY_DN8465_c0_g1~~TRINITY_DN8465_c0_g1_i1.p1  ORF type:complete len:111 (-),score=8.62 TRINITY_DN8465_c0_g1_i1:101-433(-)
MGEEAGSGPVQIGSSSTQSESSPIVEFDKYATLRFDAIYFCFAVCFFDLYFGFGFAKCVWKQHLKLILVLASKFFGRTMQGSAHYLNSSSQSLGVVVCLQAFQMFLYRWL